MIRDKIISEMAELQNYIEGSQNTFIKINNLIYSKARLIGDMVDEAIETHVSEEAYQKGLDDAWECASKITNLDTITQKDMFEVDNSYPSRQTADIFEEYTASEAIAKIKAYEEQKKAEQEEIKVGDEVYLLNYDTTAVVTAIWRIGAVSIIDLLSGKTYIEEPKRLNKTGRTFPQIAEVLKQLQEEEE